MGSVKLDLEAMVEEWGMRYYARKATWRQRKWLEKDCVRISIDWRRVVFEHEPTSYDPDPPAVGSGTPHSLILFAAYFKNKTNSKQKYTFSTERSTRSTCKLDIERGYTLGKETNVKLATPCKIAQASVGFKEELSLSTSEGQTIEKEMTWGTNSEIEVDPRSQAEAKLIIDEEEYEGHFKTVTRIRGRVKINYTNSGDNNNFIKAVEADIDAVAKASGFDLRGHGAEIEGRTLVCTTEGRCQFKYGIKQTVEVDQTPFVE